MDDAREMRFRELIWRQSDELEELRRRLRPVPAWSWEETRLLRLMVQLFGHPLLDVEVERVPTAAAPASVDGESGGEDRWSQADVDAIVVEVEAMDRLYADEVDTGRRIGFRP